MSREQFDAALAEAIREYPAGAREGWKADFGGLHLPGVELCKVRMTGAPVAQIETHCRAEDAGLSAQAVAEGLEQFWAEMIFRSEPEAHTPTVTTGSVVLEAFTVHASHYVCVRVTVDMSRTAEA